VSVTTHVIVPVFPLPVSVTTHFHVSTAGETKSATVSLNVVVAAVGVVAVIGPFVHVSTFDQAYVYEPVPPAVTLTVVALDVMSLLAVGPVSDPDGVLSVIANTNAPVLAAMCAPWNADIS